MCVAVGMGTITWDFIKKWFASATFLTVSISQAEQPLRFSEMNTVLVPFLVRVS